MLDPDVVLRADRAAVDASASRRAQGAPALAPEVRGAAVVADTFSGRARFAQPALVNGVVGAVFAPGGEPRVAFNFRIAGGKIVEIEILAGAARLGELLVILLPR
jgi:RNA polymerase sigma-70 factor (ECF subfamily)